MVNVLSIDIKKLVIDALKPREISLAELAKAICNIDCVEDVMISVAETDMRTETVRMILAGTGICYDDVLKVLNENSTALKSVDEIAVSKKQKKML
jgi:hypothetical protein